MHRIFAAAIGTVSLAVVLGGAGLATASVTPAVSGTEHLQIVSTSATAKESSLIATGVFTAGGVSNVGPTAGTVKFPGGTIRIRHSPGTGRQAFNRRTCLLTVDLHGTYTLDHGTGKYAGISGHGTYQLSILAIAARSGGRCSQRKPPVAFQQIITASGPVSLP